MNIKTIFAAIAVTAAGSAAAEAVYPYVDHSKFTSTKTRAEVRAELERDYAAGIRTADRSPEFFDFTYAVSTRSREEVQREAIEAARAPESNASAGG
ncbi:MAG TPA: DUF4148 domain-containing protein [Noviherbaspirillum sp.]|uniref:DUF4148 domain-containing protein n=1 Tax=Noviherbaspirillum sp. TaxID=1926288 RepID=UPI002D69A670|nr:DUF4148 domain-containing protein [Noviherbaspirillum sp.]HYD95270.1 DUF4148 domain-containing protein [Noviherbaspirillum sp.]